MPKWLILAIAISLGATACTASTALSAEPAASAPRPTQAPEPTAAPPTSPPEPTAGATAPPQPTATAEPTPTPAPTYPEFIALSGEKWQQFIHTVVDCEVLPVTKEEFAPAGAESFTCTGSPFFQISAFELGGQLESGLGAEAVRSQNTEDACRPVIRHSTWVFSMSAAGTDESRQARAAFIRLNQQQGAIVYSACGWPTNHSTVTELVDAWAAIGQTCTVLTVDTPGDLARGSGGLTQAPPHNGFVCSAEDGAGTYNNIVHLDFDTKQDALDWATEVGGGSPCRITAVADQWVFTPYEHATPFTMDTEVFAAAVESLPRGQMVSSCS